MCPLVRALTVSKSPAEQNGGGSGLLLLLLDFRWWNRKNQAMLPTVVARTVASAAVCGNNTAVLSLPKSCVMVRLGKTNWLARIDKTGEPLPTMLCKTLLCEEEDDVAVVVRFLEVASCALI